MSKSPKELYAVPEWMRKFLPIFQNTGGNDVETLLHDEDTNMFANSIRYMFIVSARSQFALLMDMHEKGLITEALAVNLPKRSVGEVMHMSGFSRDYAEGWCAGNDNAIHEIRAAGIGVKGE
ncbi:hypothetical protein MPC91_003520 [Salmonella enterica]|nr:hypothetical protein [Salmonella enterica]EKH9091433.1 hypothetical protein [Salmonella enterica]EKO4187426.1 hypothetical protein [Salmonella enterica]ELK3040164.1 hypothetical protein [Salmonella enterica]ELM2317047.1 hypothetical protein [Salmonella enterica]